MKKTTMILAVAFFALFMVYFHFYKPHKTFEIEIRNGYIQSLAVGENELLSTPKHLRVSLGDLVTIKITSDKDDILHIHGYEQRLELESGKQAEISFTVDKAGRFQIEMEISKADLGIIEVLL